jgi:hypothetical protein
LYLEKVRDKQVNTEVKIWQPLDIRGLEKDAEYMGYLLREVPNTNNTVPFYDFNANYNHCIATWRFARTFPNGSVRQYDVGEESHAYSTFDV